MSQRSAIAIFVVAVTAIALGRVSRAPAADPVREPTIVPAVLPTPKRVRQIGPLAATINAPPLGTPAIDLNARLATRRRIEREGTRVYLDSMFATTDSVVIRWADHSPTITVWFDPDTTRASWRATVEDARIGMRTWAENPSGFSFREVTDSAADVIVRWSVMLEEESQLGLTLVVWDADGIIRSAVVTLGLLQNPDSIPAPPPVRRRIAAHEFGHVLGLPHSSRTDDLMYPSSPVFSPSRRDLATLQLLYAVNPGSIRTP